MRWLGLFSAVILVAACSDDTTETAGAGGSAGGGAQPAGGTGGTAGMGGVGGVGGMGGGGMGGQGGQCQNTLPNEPAAPALLSATGLYTDTPGKVLAPYVREFAPQFPLWTDDAVKTRWIYLPECSPVIDNMDDDVWDFPVGTRAWKEFVRDGLLIETRMIHRYGPGADDFILVAYRWNDANTEADRLSAGEIDAKGTEHDIPTEEDCKLCHGNGLQNGGTPARYLGFSAIQLSHGGPGITMATLSANGELSIPNAAGYTVPGNATEQAALGYLHSNCGSCHNSTSDGLFTVDALMQLRVATTNVAMTQSFTTLVDQDLQQFSSPNCNKLIDGADVANSCVVQRMSTRGPDTDPGEQQMPPLGTGEVDATGVAAVTAWVNALP